MLFNKKSKAHLFVLILLAFIYFLLEEFEVSVVAVVGLVALVEALFVWEGEEILEEGMGACLEVAQGFLEGEGKAFH